MKFQSHAVDTHDNCTASSNREKGRETRTMKQTEHTCMSISSPVYSAATVPKTRCPPWLHGNTCSTPGALCHSPNLGESTVEVHGAA